MYKFLITIIMVMAFSFHAFADNLDPCFTYGEEDHIRCLEEDDFEILREALIENIGMPVYTIAPNSVYVDFRRIRGYQFAKLYYTVVGSNSYARSYVDTNGLSNRQSHCWLYIDYNEATHAFDFDIDTCPYAGILPQDETSIVKVNLTFLNFQDRVVATGSIPLD